MRCRTARKIHRLVLVNKIEGVFAVSVKRKRIEIRKLGNSLSEAALDLGCTPLQAFFKVKLPNIMPGVLSGMVMAFTMSLDDFVISYFVGSSNFQTLPLLIYSMTKKKVTPDMYALSSIIVVTIFVLLVISNLRSGKKIAKAKSGGKNK